MTKLYIRAYGVDMKDVAPGSGFRSFDAFFTRALRENARTISDDGIVCPADGKLVASGPVEHGSRIIAKGARYDVAELVGDSADAEALVGGSFAVVYLSPRDYHRVHSPVEGRIALVRGIPGDLYPVNAIGERHVPQLFVKNQRVAVCIDTPSLGRVVVVFVGAMIVGRISVGCVPSASTPLGVHRIEPAVAVRKGDEIGMFHLGSTVVLLAGPGPKLAQRTGAVVFGESLLSPLKAR